MRAYLDNSATTPVASEVMEAMLPYFSGEFGNAQSVHSFGQRAKAAVETARRNVAALINASPAEIVFVSGGTEADNLALRGTVDANRRHGNHIITSSIEHPAVLATCQALEAEGFSVTYLQVSRHGRVDAEDVRRALRPETFLVSIMHANNETGVVQPIEDIARVISEARATRPVAQAVQPASRRQPAAPIFHTDAVQSVAKIPVDVGKLGVDLLSLSAHKIHGPKGVGALFVRKGAKIGKLFYGGHHERDRRPGTENVSGIVGLGKAAELARGGLNERIERMRDLRDYLEHRILSRLAAVRVNGDVTTRVPAVSNLSFRDLDGEGLLIALDLKGVAVSTGSACASGSLEPSHVLVAMGLTKEEIRGSLRFSLSAFTTREEVDFALDSVEEVVSRLRALAPGEFAADSR
jgi:cysteine desulfurase